MYQDGLIVGELTADRSIKLPRVEKLKSSRLVGPFSALVSLLLLVIVALQFRDLKLELVAKMIPASPAFWVIFAAYYLTGPLSEWIIYRKLWGIPFTGMTALLRKLVSNELLLGYLGEAQFYAWARKRLNMVAAPFGAIKDVTLLSALVGNLVTLLMLICAWPLIASGLFGVEMRPAVMSLGVVLITSLAILLLRQKLFSLPSRDLWFITAVHSLRVVAILGLAAVMWHLVLPEVSTGLWLVMATLRMLVSRLPFIPNKDVAFAGLAIFVMGHDLQIGGLMTMMAALLLAAHFAVGIIFGLIDLLETGRSK
jgi:hypothetical protein